ncbi:MAG TPA: TrmJ/YjtD family RNA methyltransferase [Candidatus Cloacimonadota bacterium]|nr:TrmJ/YjtD family RNA methyltransferase [Candidatus Cloacimonadota bacterium]
MDNLYIILVEPVYKGNIGAVSRIMHNFSFYNLRIVGKMPEKEDKILAMHSEMIMNKAEIFPDLKSSLHDIDRAIAVTRRFGRKKKIDFTPTETAKYVHDSTDLKVALVFGRETYGLTDEEIEQCQLRTYINANEDFSSLNLSQAVAIMLYEIYSYQRKQNELEEHVNQHEIDDTILYSLEVFEQIGYFKSFPQDNVRNLLQSLFYRANITKPMAYKIKAMFNRIHVLQKGKGYGFKMTKEEEE